MAVLTAAVDFPFEDAQEIAAKLAKYEEEFKHRYTERDPWYELTSKRQSRWYQVPTMNPWPPKRPSQRRRYEDWDSGQRRGGYRSGGGWGRSRGHAYQHGRDRYYEDQSHGHWAPWHHSSRSPRPHEGYRGDRERSPHRSPTHPGPWGRGHSPPHTHSHQPPQHPAHHEHPRQRKSRSRSPSPWRPRESPRQQHSSPRQQEAARSPRHPEETMVHDDNINTPEHSGIIDQEKDEAPPLTMPPPPPKVQPEEESSSQSETEGGSKPRPPPLDLSEIAGLGQPEQKGVPSQSDVMDILSIASKGSNTVTSTNLKQVQRETHQQISRKAMKTSAKSKRKRSHQKNPSSHRDSLKPTDSHHHSSSGKKAGLKVPHSHTHSGSILHISHGAAEAVPATLVVEGGAMKGGGETGVEVDGHLRSKAIAAATAAKEETKKPHKRKPRIIEESDSSSASEEELDVTTPVDLDTASGISANRPVLNPLGGHLTAGELSEPLLVRVNRTLISQYHQSPVTPTVVPDQGQVNVVEPMQHHSDASVVNESEGCGPLHDQSLEDPCNTSMEEDSVRYAVEYNPSMTTKVIIRTQQPSIEQQTDSKKKAKKSKKKKKSKSKNTLIAQDEQGTLKVKISLPSTSQYQ